MLALSSGVEYFRVSCHVVKMKFGEICCVPAVRELFVPTYGVGKKVKLKQSRYRPGVAQRVPGRRFADFMTTGQEGGKVVSPTHRPHLPSGNHPGTHFC
jgi:hypothetical protein